MTWKDWAGFAAVQVIALAVFAVGAYVRLSVLEEQNRELKQAIGDSRQEARQSTIENRQAIKDLDAWCDRQAERTEEAINRLRAH